LWEAIRFSAAYVASSQHAWWRGRSQLSPRAILAKRQIGRDVRYPQHREHDGVAGAAVEQGLELLDAVFGVMLLLGLALTLSYALLVYDEALSTAFAKIVGGEDSTVYAYGLAVDSDLESVFFGNLLFVIVMSLIGIATYTLTNLFLPAGMHIPMAFTLGVLTGITSLIPIVVSKVVYVPILASLALSTTRDGSGQLLLVAGLLVVYALVLDILPQSFLQPIISGRQLNPMILLFAYLLGPILWGWYGFLLMPIVFVLMLEAVRIVLPELLHGEPIDTEPDVAVGVGATEAEMQDDDLDVSSSVDYVSGDDRDGPSSVDDVSEDDRNGPSSADDLSEDLDESETGALSDDDPGRSRTGGLSDDDPDASPASEN
jgi:hypothetical protein